MESNFRLTLNNLNSLSGVLTVLHDVAKCTINNLSGKTELRLSQLYFIHRQEGSWLKLWTCLHRKDSFTSHVNFRASQHLEGSLISSAEVPMVRKILLPRYLNRKFDQFAFNLIGWSCIKCSIELCLFIVFLSKEKNAYFGRCLKILLKILLICDL